MDELVSGLQFFLGIERNRYLYARMPENRPFPPIRVLA